MDLNKIMENILTCGSGALLSLENLENQLRYNKIKQYNIYLRTEKYTVHHTYKNNDFASLGETHILCLNKDFILKRVSIIGKGNKYVGLSLDISDLIDYITPPLKVIKTEIPVLFITKSLFKLNNIKIYNVE